MRTFGSGFARKAALLAIPALIFAGTARAALDQEALIGFWQGKATKIDDGTEMPATLDIVKDGDKLKVYAQNEIIIAVFDRVALEGDKLTLRAGSADMDLDENSLAVKGTVTDEKVFTFEVLNGGVPSSRGEVKWVDTSRMSSPSDEMLTGTFGGPGLITSYTGDFKVNIQLVLDVEGENVSAKFIAKKDLQKAQGDLTPVEEQVTVVRRRHNRFIFEAAEPNGARKLLILATASSAGLKGIWYHQKIGMGTMMIGK